MRVWYYSITLDWKKACISESILTNDLEAENVIMQKKRISGMVGFRLANKESLYGLPSQEPLDGFSRIYIYI